MGEFITFSAGVLSAGLMLLVHFRRPPSEFWPSLFLVNLAVTMWAFGELFTAYITVDQQWYWMWLVIEYMGVLGLAPAWWILILRYSEACGHPVRWAVRPVRLAPIGFAGVFWVILITNPIHQSFVSAAAGTPIRHLTLWYVQAGWNYALIITSIGVLAWLSWKSLRTDRAIQVRILLVAAIAPLIANTLHTTKIVDFGFDITVGVFAVLCVVFFVGIYKHRLFGLNSVTLNHVVDNEPDAFIITDNGGRVCFANESAKALFGQGSALIDTNVFPVMDAVFERVDRPNAPPGFAQISDPDTDGQRLESGTLVRLRGTARHFVFQHTTIPGWRGVVRGIGVRLIDVSSAERTKRQLAEHAGAMEAILGSIVEGILVVDLDGTIVFFNDVFQEMWQLPSDILDRGNDDEAIRLVLDQVKDPEAFVNRIQELYESPEKTSRHDEIEFNGGRIVERSSRPLYIVDQPVGRVWTFRDVTAIRKEAEERRQLELKILEAQKLDSLGMMAGGIAHDFNNLLVGVLGNAELAIEDVSENSELKRHLEAIAQSSRRAGELCRQLLAYSGQGQIVVIPIDLSEIVEDMESLLSVSISKRCELVMQLDDELPAVEADVTQVRQVIMNLVANAADAVGDTEGTVTVRTGVAVCSRDDLSELIVDDDVAPGACVYVEVEDTGSGMSDDSLARIFDPFYTTKFAGRGLGLAAVRGIARSHRAALDVSTKEGEGTRVRVLFPASAAEAKSVREPAPTAEGPHETGTVLVVDDEPQVLDVMGQILRHAGYEVVTASDGSDAVDVFAKRHEELRAVVLDMTMPGLSGKEAYQQMRGITAAIPIVLASGYSEEEVIDRIGENRAPTFLQKPFQSKELLHALDTAIRTTN